MRWKPIRILAALSSLTATVYALDQVEKHRAVSPPSGWNRVSGAPLATAVDGPAIGTSAWRVGPDTRWRSDTEATQLYVRPELSGSLGLTLAAGDRVGTWVWVSSQGPVTASRAGEQVSCMGSIVAPADIAPVALTDQDDSILVTWGDQRMICPAPLADDRSNGGRPGLQTSQSSVLLRSIGRDKRTDGVPLSPLWWMSGLMVGGLLGMLSLDLFLSIVGRIRPATVHSED